jgi:hypothetical protein
MPPLMRRLRSNSFAFSLDVNMTFGRMKSGSCQFDGSGRVMFVRIKDNECT